ncbi:MAG: hypothetical protein M3238_03690, partial [Actinomycetota bacterium]|nr:hypothetical protein [Actinomycetota bacterium]
MASRSAEASLNPLWVKAPLVLLRFPGLLLSLAAGALLLALAAASFPLFLSATSSAALAAEIRSVSRFGAGLQITKTSLLVPTVPRYGRLVTPKASMAEFRQRERAVAEATRGPHLDEVVATYLAPPVIAYPVGRPRRSDPFRPIFRTGAYEHVVAVAGREGAGVWMADLPARRLGVRPGDRITIEAASGPGSITVGVDGIYKALFNEPPDPYWRSLSREIYPSGDSGAPPTFLLGDLESTVTIASAVRAETVVQRFEAPLSGGNSITLDDARRIEAVGKSIESQLLDERTRLGGAFCYQCFGGGPRPNPLINLVVSETERRVAPVEGPVRLLLVAGVLVALAVVAAAGAFAVATRRVEADFLFARGMSPLTMATKTVAESFIPAIVGAAAGLGVAWALVVLLGPPGTVDENAFSLALRLAALAVPVSIVLLGTVAAFAFARRAEATGERLTVLARVPWEVGLIFLGLFFLGRLLTGGALVRATDTGITRPSVYLLLFPI